MINVLSFHFSIKHSVQYLNCECSDRVVFLQTHSSSLICLEKKSADQKTAWVHVNVSLTPGSPKTTEESFSLLLLGKNILIEHSWQQSPSLKPRGRKTHFQDSLFSNKILYTVKVIFSNHVTLDYLVSSSLSSVIRFTKENVIILEARSQ